MNCIEARYLKHSGDLIDVKVSIKIVGNDVVIYIRDSEFIDFKKALAYLRHIAENEIVPEKSLDM